MSDGKYSERCTHGVSNRSTLLLRAQLPRVRRSVLAMLPSLCIWRNTSTHAASSCIPLVAGYPSPEIISTKTSAGELQMPSLDEHMNREGYIHARMSPRVKDVPAWLMDAIRDVVVAVAYDVILPSKLPAPLSEASLPASPLQACCTSTTIPLPCCIRH